MAVHTSTGLVPVQIVGVVRSSTTVGETGDANTYAAPVDGSGPSAHVGTVTHASLRGGTYH